MISAWQCFKANSSGTAAQGGLKRRESQGNLRGDQQCRYRGLGPVNKGRTHVRKNAWNERPVGSGHQLDVGQEREMEESKKATNLQVSIQGDVVSVTRKGMSGAA